jgi:hypothetical protein
VAGKIIADIIEAPAGRISLNVANVTVASINASGLYTSTGDLLITQANSIATAAIENGAVTSAKIAPSAIVGTVSQSGGVPTGAIIERGSNANGEFVKYADGTMICTHGISLLGVAPGGGASTTNFASAYQATWTYPSAFVTAPRSFGDGWQINTVSRAVIVGTESFDSTESGSSTGNSTRWYAISDVSWSNVSSNFPTVRLCAIGRWF